MNKTKQGSKPRSDELLEQVKKLCEKEGTKGWKLAQETMLNHKTCAVQLQEAINYIMIEYKPEFFRPAIVSLCSEAVGGDPDKTVPFGASLVLLARAIGIHDDIIDKLKLRNKRRTLFGKFGTDIALILSDVLLFEGFTLMQKSSELGVSQQTMSEILETIDCIWFEQSEGEIFEIQSRKQESIAPQACLAKINMRSSELEAITRIGGILGGGSQKEINNLGKFGRSLGVMSILRDEIIDMLEFDVLRHRIRNESLPLPIIYATQNSEAKSKIMLLLSKRKLTVANLKMISKVTDNAGGIDYAAGIIRDEIRKAFYYVNKLRNKKEELKLLATSVAIEPEKWKPLL
jgi:geranylgeranyl pyrophosphate synthase